MEENPKTPINTLISMFSSLVNTGHEKALKQGIYNAVAFFILCLISLACYGLYIVLSPFARPLLWAVLCGAVLFPFKLSLTNAAHSWFSSIEASGRPLLLVSLTTVPIQIVDGFSEKLGLFLWDNSKKILGAIGAFTFTLFAYHYTPVFLSNMVWNLFNGVHIILGFFVLTCSIYMITTLLIGYMTILYFYWTPENNKNFRYSSFVIWFIISLYLSNVFGAYQVLTFFTLQVFHVVGFVYEVLCILERREVAGRHTTFIEGVRYALSNDDRQQTVPASIDESTESEPPSAIENVTTVEEKRVRFQNSTQRSTPELRRSMSLEVDEETLSRKKKAVRNFQNLTRSVTRDRYILRRIKSELRMTLDLDLETEKVDSNKYIYGVLYACTGMLLWKHKWILQILTLPAAYYFFKQLGSYFGLWQAIAERATLLADCFVSWCSDRHCALIPAHVKGLYKLSIIVEDKMTKALKSSVDSVATIAVILGLLLFVTCASVFITMQVYAEGMHMVQVTGEILNSTLMSNPDIDWVPQQWEASMNSVLDNAYTYGRSAISDGIKSLGLVKDLEPAKAEQIEKKVLELWDRLYQSWMMSNMDSDLIGPKVDVNSAYNVWESIQEHIGKMPFQMLNLSSIENFAKENIGTLMSVLDSIWGIIKGNASVILSILTELLYFILMGSSVVLNFALNTIVFFTTLFYLLSSSGATYKPIEVVTAFSPISCYKFATTLQESIIGIFTATFKLASFFGMWTWFTHNLFQVKIVYLPSALAAVLGAVPFLDAYFACLPATLELWFNRGAMTAIVFFLFHFVPCNIVVTEFYKEIKGGGHPYLTGLSIAGGIFCLGVEGAIFGPLLLSCIMVIVQMGRRYLTSPSDEQISTLKSHINKMEASRPKSEN